MPGFFMVLAILAGGIGVADGKIPSDGFKACDKVTGCTHPAFQ